MIVAVEANKKRYFFLLLENELCNNLTDAEIVSLLILFVFCFWHTQVYRSNYVNGGSVLAGGGETNEDADRRASF